MPSHELNSTAWLTNRGLLPAASAAPAAPRPATMWTEVQDLQAAFNLAYRRWVGLGTAEAKALMQAAHATYEAAQNHALAQAGIPTHC